MRGMRTCLLRILLLGGIVLLLGGCPVRDSGSGGNSGTDYGGGGSGGSSRGGYY